MMNTVLTKILVYLIVGIWALTALLMGLGVPDGFWKPLGVVSLATSLIVIAYDKWLWAFIPSRFSGVPDLRGTWCGSILSNWRDPETGTTPGPIEAYFVVRQTNSTVSVAMFTRESRSMTVAAKLEKTDVEATISGVYRNEPSASVRHRSAIHFGGLRLHVGGPPPTTMKGAYWTDRGSCGDLELELGSRTTASDFATAEGLCAGMVTSSIGSPSTG